MVIRRTWAVLLAGAMFDVKVLNTPDHRLRKNARISWETFGFHIESRVWEFESSSRLGWFT
jgi:hypothetical protein